MAETKKEQKNTKKEDIKKSAPKGLKKNFEVKASLRFLRMSPKKVRLVAKVLKRLSVGEALDQLQFISKAAAQPLTKLIKSAIANAENNFGLEKENLVIKKLIVNEGPTLKRWKPRAHGRATPIRKRSSHIELVLEDISGQQPKKEKAKKLEEVKVVSPEEAKKVTKVEDKESKDKEEKEKFYKKGFTKRLFSRKTGTN